MIAIHVKGEHDDRLNARRNANCSERGQVGRCITAAIDLLPVNFNHLLQVGHPFENGERGEEEEAKGDQPKGERCCRDGGAGKEANDVEGC